MVLILLKILTILKERCCSLASDKYSIYLVYLLIYFAATASKHVMLHDMLHDGNV